MLTLLLLYLKEKRRGNGDENSGKREKVGRESWRGGKRQIEC